MNPVRPLTIYIDPPGPFFTKCQVNNIQFAFFTQPQNFPRNETKIDLSEHIVVFLAPLQCEGDLIVKATTLIALEKFSVKGAAILEVVRNVFFGKTFEYSSVLECGERVKPTKVDPALIHSIIQSAKRALADRDGPMMEIVLLDIHRACTDPYPEKPQSDREEMCKFFQIPKLRGE